MQGGPLTQGMPLSQGGPMSMSQGEWGPIDYHKGGNAVTCYRVYICSVILCQRQIQSYLYHIRMLCVMRLS